MKYFILFFFLSVFGIQLYSQPAKTTEGYVNVEGGRIWYKMVGNGEKTPLVILHGGPGGRSCYMIPVYSALSDERPVIFYDQLGSGNSDRVGDTTLWSLPCFVNEIDSIRKALELDQIHLLGSSWGAAVVVEYMVTKDPEGVRSVIFSGPLISTPQWMEDAEILLEQLPQNLQDTITKYEALENYQAPAYIAASDSFYRRFMRHTRKPVITHPECHQGNGFNEAIYNYMWGPTEFTARGTLKTFDRSADLPKIKQAILFMAGRYDEARPETMYEFRDLSQNARVVIIEDSGHASLFDQPEAVIKTVRDFLNQVEDQ